MSAWFRAVLSGLLLLTLTMTGLFAEVASADSAPNSTADTAIAVSGANPSITGSMTGAGNGAYRYYRFAYPGANTVVRVHLTWNPGWSSTANGFNFNVYGPSGLVGQGQRGDDAGPASTSYLDVVTPAPGDYLVQVYSYTQSTFQNFTLDFTGLGAAPVAVVTNNSTPAQAATVTQQSSSMSGSLVGKGNGAFAFFNVEYPGGNWPMTVSVSFSPANQLPVNAFGFLVWQDDTLVATGVETSRDFDNATKSADVTVIPAGKYTVQVVNYADGVNASYVLGINGVSASTLNVTGNTTPDKSVTLTAQTNTARGQLAGAGNGSFAFFGVNYQGGKQPLTISVSYAPGRNATGSAVGVNIFRGSQLVMTSVISDGRTLGSGMAYQTYSADDAGYLGIQLFNYQPGVTIDYSIYAMGLK